MTESRRLHRNIVDRMYFVLFYRKKLRELGDEIITVDDAIVSRTAVNKYGAKTVTDFRIEHFQKWRCVIEVVQYGNAAPRPHIRSIWPVDEGTVEAVHTWIRRRGEVP